MKVILRLHSKFTARWQIEKLFTALRSTLKQTYFKHCLPEFLSFWICSLLLVAVIKRTRCSTCSFVKLIQSLPTKVTPPFTTSSKNEHVLNAARNLIGKCNHVKNSIPISGLVGYSQLKPRLSSICYEGERHGWIR